MHDPFWINQAARSDRSTHVERFHRDISQGSYSILSLYLVSAVVTLLVLFV